MTTSRRDLLRLTSIGLGSLALSGWAAGGAAGDQPRRPLHDKDDKLVPGITIDNIYSGMVLGTSFTVVGTYYPDGTVDPAITCAVQSASQPAQYADQRWQADFAGVGAGDNITIVATMKGSTKNYTATVIDITVLANPGGLMVDAINSLALKTGGDDRAKSKIGYTPTASGKVDDYEALVATYYSSGTETGERAPVSVKNNKWKQIHKFDPKKDDKKSVALVLTALVWEAGRSAPRLYQVSRADLQVGT